MINALFVWMDTDKKQISLALFALETQDFAALTRLTHSLSLLANQVTE